MILFRRTLTAMLVLTFFVTPLAGIATANGQFMPYDPPIKMRTIINRLDPTVQFKDGDTPENNVWSRLYLERLGIDTEIIWAANVDQSAEKVNLAIAADDLPDVFAVNRNQFEQLVATGKLADLTEAYEEYASDFIRDVMIREGSDQALDACSVDGKLYGIPYFLNWTDETKLIWIREDWRLTLGIPEPKTMQDMLALARAFQEADLGETGMPIGIGLDEGSLDGSGGNLATFLNGFHAYPGAWLDDGTGNLINGVVQAEPMKAGLSALAELYADGVIDQAFGSQRHDESILPAINNNQLGVIFGGLWEGWWPLGEMKNVDESIEWKCYPVLSIDEKPAKIQASSLNLITIAVVNAKYEHPEAAIKMANLCAEMLWQSSAEDFAIYGYDAAGNNPWCLTNVYFEFPGKNHTLYKNSVAALDTGIDDNLTGEEVLIYNWMRAYRDDDDLSRWGIWLSYGPGSSCSLIDYYLENDLYELNLYYGNPTQSMLDNQAILDKLFKDYAYKIIIGELPVDAYDEFITKWYEQGGGLITDDVNEWYEDKQ
jgi:putative aldouronate transport system substrate-binding protein